MDDPTASHPLEGKIGVPGSPVPLKWWVRQPQQVVVISGADTTGPGPTTRGTTGENQTTAAPRRRKGKTS